MFQSEKITWLHKLSFPVAIMCKIIIARQIDFMIFFYRKHMTSQLRLVGYHGNHRADEVKFDSL